MPRFTDPRFGGKFTDPRASSGDSTKRSGSSYSQIDLDKQRSAEIPTYQGLKYPFRFQNGRPVLSSGAQHIKESIRQIIMTWKGESILEPEFGCDIHKRTFSPVNTLALARHDLERALRRWEPRVELLDVEVDSSRSDRGIAGLNVSYRILAETEIENTTIEFGG